MTLREKRALFSFSISRLVLWIGIRWAEGVQVAYDEGLVKHTDAADGDHDGPHRAGGAHYTGLGADLVVWRQQVDERTGAPLDIWLPITDGSDPVWTEIGLKWEGMHPLCRWGGRFNDANHFSLEHEGRA